MKLSLLNASYPLKAPSWTPQNEINPPCHFNVRSFTVILYHSPGEDAAFGPETSSWSTKWTSPREGLPSVTVSVITHIKKIMSTGCQESYFYGLSLGQAVASMCLPKGHGSSVIWIPPKHLTCLLGKLRTEFITKIAKSTLEPYAIAHNFLCTLSTVI